MKHVQDFILIVAFHKGMFQSVDQTFAQKETWHTQDLSLNNLLLIC